MEPTGLTLRAAAPDDIETIARIWHRGWSDGHVGHVPDALLPHRHLEDFRRRVPPRIPETTVATIAGAIVGFVTVREDEVEQVYVAAEVRGTGVADALLRHVEERVGARFDVAWLSVVEGNARARRFYERNGWRDVGAHDYRAEIRGSTLPVPCRRYEKTVKRRD
jgi:ribosomal protein S18 acetylase RimI-like enzyme